MKKEALLSCGWHDKKTSDFFRAFWYNQFLVIWGLRPRTNSGQVSWLKAQHPPPPSRNIRSSDRCSCTLAVNSLITVTRSCGICTRFPFNVPAPGQSRGRYAPAVFLFSSLFSITYSTEECNHHSGETSGLTGGVFSPIRATATSLTLVPVAPVMIRPSTAFRAW